MAGMKNKHIAKKHSANRHSANVHTMLKHMSNKNSLSFNFLSKYQNKSFFDHNYFQTKVLEIFFPWT